MASTHLVQSPQWGKFKNEYGTKAVRVENIMYTVHKIPFTSYYYAYCPKVNPFEIKWSVVKQSMADNNCVALNFDVPNVLKGSTEEKEALEMFRPNCEKSPKNTFAQFNILLDLNQSEEKLLENMHKKHRYNLKYAQKKGVLVKQGQSPEDFENFFSLLKSTAVRQKYYIHPKEYYKKIWELLQPLGMCRILNANFEDKVLASWMLFTYEGVLYYPYGGSSEENQNLFASTLVCWEAIKLGKSLECKTFDMWGAAKDVNDTTDPWYGFTNFKIKFGGRHVEYMDSYDLILNPTVYKLFNAANDLRWKILTSLK